MASIRPKGIQVFTIVGSELGRGRGMTCPISRSPALSDSRCRAIRHGRMAGFPRYWTMVQLSKDNLSHRSWVSHGFGRSPGADQQKTQSERAAEFPQEPFRPRQHTFGPSRIATGPELAAPEATTWEATTPEATVQEATGPELTVQEATAPESTAREATAPELTVQEATGRKDIVPLGAGDNVTTGSPR